LSDPSWQNSTILGQYDPEAIRRLKADVDGDIYVSGSGARLFPEDAEPLNLSLTACEGYENGAIHLGYEPSPQTG
jgi:hypothetical protein